MKTVSDHLGREVSFTFPPKKIVSLCPAITETMYRMELQDEIVGRTRFCIHPQPDVKNAMNIGGTKDLHIERIHELKPDLIIAEKEENTKEMVAELEPHYPVFVFEIQTFSEALRMIHDVGMITGREDQASSLVQKIEAKFLALPDQSGSRIAYVIWKKPYMVVGKNTYIQSLLDKMGFVNPFTKYEGRYPAITEDDLQAASLDYLFLATEPYPFKEKDLPDFKELLPKTIPLIVDGEMFWYGGMMLEAASYFKKKFGHL